ncbi:hypothetical protein ACMFMG_001900 [Clarireedia jacksonii]
MANAQATIASYIASLESFLEKGALPTDKQLKEMCMELMGVLRNKDGSYVADTAAREQIGEGLYPRLRPTLNRSSREEMTTGGEDQCVETSNQYRDYRTAGWS